MIRAAIVGATGYTGAELVRLLSSHPAAELVCAVGNSRAGEPLGRVLPGLRGLEERTVEALDLDGLVDRADVVFCALPHGTSAPIVHALRERAQRVFDLSADFRIRRLETYEAWYGEHGAPERFGEAVYGLPELHREAIRTADLVAVPGCYPTASLLAVGPAVGAGLVATDGPIVIDAKSGVSGAGRGVKARTHFSETAESLRAYAVAGQHRHTPEIEQELGRLAGGEVRILFSPHLVPMVRGILVTAYLPTTGGANAAQVTAAARERYAGSPSVTVLEPGECPDTAWVRGSNRALVSYTDDARSGWVVAQGAIDNLVKGASGQALQCMNLRFGLDEGAGLMAPPVWP